jgi:hypothetical protein
MVTHGSNCPRSVRDLTWDDGGPNFGSLSIWDNCRCRLWMFVYALLKRCDPCGADRQATLNKMTASRTRQSTCGKRGCYAGPSQAASMLSQKPSTIYHLPSTTQSPPRASNVKMQCMHANKIVHLVPPSCIPDTLHSPRATLHPVILCAIVSCTPLSILNTRSISSYDVVMVW